MAFLTATANPAFAVRNPWVPTGGFIMAFTDNCDLFVSIHEEGVNRIGWHIMRQRPMRMRTQTQTLSTGICSRL